MFNTMKIIFVLIFLVEIAISIAFITLLERKILGYIHIRKGPNKVGYVGIFQPFSDALKLFSKELMKLERLNFFIFCWSPFYGLILLFLIWISFPNSSNMLWMPYGMIFIIGVMTLSLYFLLGSGWSSGVKYSIMGAYRSVAQNISFEVSFMFLVLCYICFSWSSNIMTFNMMYSKNICVLIFWFIFIIWVPSCLAELNRTPFDFSEGESELVSGFNTEYGGGLFSLIFIAEYGSLIFMALVTSFIFLSGGMLMIKVWIISLLFLWIRGVLPRYRYDKLMMLAWKIYLPLSIWGLIFLVCLSIF